MQPDTSQIAWSRPPDKLDLQSYQVDVWRARLELTSHVLNQLKSTLSEEETERAARFHFSADEDRFIAAHGCLRDVLARYLHCEPRKLNFSTNRYGKPTLCDHKLEFNLTHSGEYALIAITRESKVGVDVERIRQGISSQVIAQQYFSKSEVAELQASPLAGREIAFFSCWTRKEAYIKAHGLGLSLPLESFDVSVNPDGPAMLRATRPDPHETARWTLLSLEINSCYASAIVVEGRELELRLWDWNTH